MTGVPDWLICFDLGGVLVRICRSWEEGLARAGLDADRGWTPADSDGAHRRLVAAYTIGAIDDAAFFHGLERAAGGVYTEAEFRAIHSAWLIGEYPGAADLLAGLRDAGQALACLSNTNAAHWRTLLEWPALRALRHRHASHEMGAAKPDPAIYARFARARGVAPGRIVFFDDLEENIDAARAAGWDAVRVDHGRDPVAQVRAALAERDAG